MRFRRWLVLLSLVLIGCVGSAVPHRPEAPTGYRDASGKQHDHASTARVWTVCNCKVCDRKDRCCGPDHCVCNPD